MKTISLKPNGALFNGVETLAYYPTPKVGCTTVKTIVMHLLGDSRYPNKDTLWPHDVYRHPRFDKKIDIRFCLVRDPVQRFLSGYVNRVLFAKEIPHLPIEDFIDDFQNLKNRHWTVRHHFSPQVKNIGHNLEFYTHIFDINEINSVFSLMSEFSGKEIKPFKTQTSNGMKKPNITSEYVNKIKEIYDIDYLTFGKYIK